MRASSTPSTRSRNCAWAIWRWRWGTEDAVGYALRLLRPAGMVATHKAGRVVYYRRAAGCPEPLRDHCLRRLVDLTRAAGEED